VLQTIEDPALIEGESGGAGDASKYGTNCMSSVGTALDVWMLGVVLFELLHGFSPFKRKGEPLAETRRRILQQPVEPLLGHTQAEAALVRAQPYRYKLCTGCCLTNRCAVGSGYERGRGHQY
jgi:hypothetical protein